MNTPASITVTRSEITDSARVEIELGREGQTRPLAYRVTRQRGSNRYIVRDPFGAAIDGVSTLERAVEIATGLAANVREWAAECFDC
jgi:hypothetical protein